MVKTTFSLRFFHLNRLPPFTAALSHHMITFWHIFRKRDWICATPGSIVFALPRHADAEPRTTGSSTSLTQHRACVCVRGIQWFSHTHTDGWCWLLTASLSCRQLAGGVFFNLRSNDSWRDQSTSVCVWVWFLCVCLGVLGTTWWKHFNYLKGLQLLG